MSSRYVRPSIVVSWTATLVVLTCSAVLAVDRNPPQQKSDSGDPIASRQQSLDAEVGRGVLLQGIVKAKWNALLRPTTQGTISKIHVREGQWIKTAAPLLTVDDNTARAAVEVARAAALSHAAIDQAALIVKQAQSQLSRTRIALHANASSDFEIQARELQLEQAITDHKLRIDQHQQAQAQLALAEEQLKQRTLYAPFDGNVIQVHIGVGNSVDPTQPVIHIAQLNQLTVEMHLPLKYFSKIAAGEKYSLQAFAPVNGNIEATVEYVAPVVEPTSGTFRVVFGIDNHDHRLPAGFEVQFEHPTIPTGFQYVAGD
jgi:RND family efflux transporter MFP subunit